MVAPILTKRAANLSVASRAAKPGESQSQNTAQPKMCRIRKRENFVSIIASLHVRFAALSFTINIAADGRQRVRKRSMKLLRESERDWKLDISSHSSSSVFSIGSMLPEDRAESMPAPAVKVHF